MFATDGSERSILSKNPFIDPEVSRLRWLDIPRRWGDDLERLHQMVDALCSGHEHYPARFWDMFEHYIVKQHTFDGGDYSWEREAFFR